MSDKRYTASDVKRITGMDRNTLFYCVKTLRLIKPAQALPRVTLYDLENLLDLMLFQALFNLGMSQNDIKRILKGEPTIDKPPRYITVWREFRNDREKFEKEGYWLRITALNKGGAWWNTNALRDVRTLFKPYNGPQLPGHEHYPRNGVIVIDLIDLIHYVEKETGEKLGPEPSP